MKKWLSLAILTVCTTSVAWLVASDASALTRYIRPGMSLQAFIDQAANGDVIAMMDGTYLASTGNANIDFKGKAITVRAVNRRRAIVHAQGTGRVFAFQSGEGPDSVLDGIQIMGGKGILGGGIYIYRAAPTIINCTISTNIALSELGVGGGMYIEEGRPAIHNNIFNGNSSSGYYGGGAIYSHLSYPSIIGNTFTGNRAGQDGGGIYLFGGSAEIVMNTFSGCTASGASGGGGICCWDSDSTILNNSFSECKAPAGSGGGLMIKGPLVPIAFANLTFEECSATAGGGLAVHGGTITLKNSIFWANVATAAGTGSTTVQWTGTWAGTGTATRAGNNLACTGTGTGTWTGFGTGDWTGDGTLVAVATDTAPGTGTWVGTFTWNGTWAPNTGTWVGPPTGTAAAQPAMGTYVTVGTQIQWTGSNSTPTRWTGTQDLTLGPDCAVFGADVSIMYAIITELFTYVQSGNLALLDFSEEDPLFANAPDDLHLQSANGRWDPVAQTWVNDAADSVGIDTGDYDSDYSREPYPNGGRINLGFEGGTDKASKSVSVYGGAVLYVEGPGSPVASTATGGSFQVNVYGENLGNVGGVQLVLMFIASSEMQNTSSLLAGSNEFQISKTGGDPVFDGQAIVVNTTAFTTFEPIYGPDRQMAGFLSTMAPLPDVPITAKTPLLTITYEYTLASGIDYTITVDLPQSVIGSTGTGDGVALPFEVITGTVSIDPAAPAVPDCGDATGDKLVNINDLIFIRNRLGQSVATGDNWRADVNGDGKINILDMIYIRTRLGNACP